ncbi:MAG: hypothetical protein NTX45_03970 [Proteobacteria bacterium]|nr:hypothetical protein [Pseudomonadota bacterium]
MRELRYTLLADGGSDRVLMPIIDWLLKSRLKKVAYSGSFHAPPHGIGLSKRVQNTLILYPCDVLFVHRDAEKEDYDTRVQEIKRELAKINNFYVAIVPVHMTEAWLLSNQSAIREAANNPNGKESLGLPPSNKWDKIPDPKTILFESLKTATGLNGRRLDKFHLDSARQRVAQLTNDFSGLACLPAFQKLCQDIDAYIQTTGLLS